MRVIIAGSRTITDPRLVEKAIEESGFEITEVVSGECRGVDRLGEKWANARRIPIKAFPALWDDLEAQPCLIKVRRDGKRYNALAGFNRNQQIADYADALIAITTGSGGTADMIRRATARFGKENVYVLEV